jgi:hypothetical protein
VPVVPCKRRDQGIKCYPGWRRQIVPFDNVKAAGSPSRKSSRRSLAESGKKGYSSRHQIWQRNFLLAASILQRLHFHLLTLNLAASWPSLSLTPACPKPQGVGLPEPRFPLPVDFRLPVSKEPHQYIHIYIHTLDSSWPAGVT